MPHRFKITAARNGQFFVRFVASNGETMVRSETYTSEASAKNCIESVKRRTAPAPPSSTRPDGGPGR